MIAYKIQIDMPKVAEVKLKISRCQSSYTLEALGFKSKPLEKTLLDYYFNEG